MKSAKLAQIEEDKIQPLIAQIEKTMGKGKLAERIISFLINIGAGILIFIAGIWLGPKVQSMFSLDDESNSTEIENSIPADMDNSNKKVLIDTTKQIIE